MAKTNNQLKIKNVFIFFSYLLLVWGLYRYLIKLPEEIEELVIKPLIWLLPLFILIKREKEKLSSLGLTVKTLFPSLYFVIGLGAVFAIEALLINFLKYGSLNLGSNIGDKTILIAVFISLVTAFSEEIAFRGYIFGRLRDALNHEWKANLISTVMWIVIHIPIVVFVRDWTVGSALVYLLITGLFGMGSNFVYARTGNVFASILLHVVWEWPLILFR